MTTTSGHGARTGLTGWWEHGGDCGPTAGGRGGPPMWCTGCGVWDEPLDWQPLVLPYGSAELESHGPAAVRAELVYRPGQRVPRVWIRGVIGGCDGCAQWYRRQARLSRMHRTYGRRRR